MENVVPLVLSPSDVSVISFEIKLRDGRCIAAEFHRQAKVQDLLDDDGSLGEFLRDMLASAAYEAKA